MWPLVNGSALQHDSYSCDVYPRARAYPVARDAAGAHVGQVFDQDDLPLSPPLSPSLPPSHVGQVFDQDGTPRRVDVEMLLAARLAEISGDRPRSAEIGRDAPCGEAAAAARAPSEDALSRSLLGTFL